MMLERLNYSRRVKRILDVVGASSVLVGLSPLLTAVVLAELVFHGWPPFFTQARGGKGNTTFRIIKFRTMRDARDSSGNPLPDEERLTAFGALLRTSSIDELPELVNVLTGEMSLVGPRPFVARYLPRYSAAQRRRHDVRPGITGWAQVRGRNSLTWEEKFEMDLWYIDNWSNSLDLEILARTLLAVVRPSGVAAEGVATMPEFEGGEPSCANPSPSEKFR